MTRLCRIALLTVLAAVGAGCSGNEGPSCSFDGATQLAATTWPKFRADPANTGRVLVDLSENTGVGRKIFPPPPPTPTSIGATPTFAPTPPPTPILGIGPVETTPILGPEYIYVASSDGNVYVMSYQGAPITLQESMQLQSAITGSPLLGANGVLFVSSNGLLTQFNTATCSNNRRVCTQDSDCDEEATCEPDGIQRSASSVVGFVAASPNIWDGDGTTFVTSQSGVFQGVCANGVARYAFGAPPTQSTVAIVEDPDPPVPDQSTAIIVTGGANGQVRAFSLDGRQKWSFFASTDIAAAVLIDESTEQFYVADTSGRIFTGALANGQPVPGFSFAATMGITASPALGRDTASVPTLYAADLGGTLYAINRATGAVRWTFDAGGPIESSPAVATGGAADVIVLGVTLTDASGLPVDGRVYAIQDDGAEPTLRWSFDTGSPIGASSPSIGTDGTVYIGAQGDVAGGAVFAIGPGA